MKAWRTLGRAARRRIVFGIAAFGALAVLAAIGLRDLQTTQREQSAIPDVEGSIALAGLQAEVTVSRDGHGVPHVAARSERRIWARARRVSCSVCDAMQSDGTTIERPRT